MIRAVNLAMLLSALAFCTPVQGGEREWEPSANALVLLHRPPAADLKAGYGMELSAAYWLGEWSAVATSFAVASFQGFTEPSSAATTSYYDATRFYLLPFVRFTPPATFAPHLLGDLFVPSLSVGLGAVAQYQTNAQLRRGSVVLKNERDAWALAPVVAAAVGFEVRPFSRLALNLNVKYTAPLTNSISDQVDVSIGAGMSLFLYP